LLTVIFNPASAGNKELYLKECVIYDASGTLLAELPGPPTLTSIQPLTANSIYSLVLNTIFAIPSSAPTWTSLHPSTTQGAVAGRWVVFVTGNHILAEPY